MRSKNDSSRGASKRRSPPMSKVPQAYILLFLFIIIISSLSIKGCSYSKSVMKHYSKQLWQSSINSQYQLEGYTEAPTV